MPAPVPKPQAPAPGWTQHPPASGSNPRRGAASPGATSGDGDAATDELPGDTGADTAGVDESVTEDESPSDGADLAHDGSPLDGVDLLIDEVREALFGEDDAGGAGPLGTDPVELDTDTDLDLTGDGLVDPADIPEAAPAVDLGVSDGGHHDGVPLDGSAPRERRSRPPPAGWAGLHRRLQVAWSVPRPAEERLATHPDLAAEQAYIEHAYDSLDEARRTATRLRSMVEVGKGGTEQARWEREMIEENIAARLEYLNLGDASLVFGRIDQARSEGGETFYIGRIAVADGAQEPLVVDWRAPVAEPFYRATGRAPMGLVRRRHFATRGRKLLGIEDELFGEGADLLGGQLTVDDDGSRVRGQSSLIAALEESRTGHLSDIVATIQGEQDEVIRSPLPGVLVVQGGPGTGKTVVALHRAAYLLYTYRFPLEGQGVLVVGPNRLFLGYIERVLPSLGEAGVELAVLADLVDEVRVRGRDRGLTARVKGDARMAKVLAKAVRDRERGLRRALRVPFGVQTLVLPAARTAEIVADARRRYRHHNAGRRFVERELYTALADVSRVPTTVDEVRERLRQSPEVREALERMWPVLTPAQLLHDLFGSAALVDLAAGRTLDGDERAALVRRRADDVDRVIWTHDDVPLLDEARALLGPRRRRANGSEPDEIRTYGHIVVDEAQDFSPMQLRMLTRRSLNGSMTVVGDIAQATGVWAHKGWDEILEHLPRRRPDQRAELTIGYRIPGPTMDLAAKVLREAAPDLQPPDAVRKAGDDPRVIRVDPAGLAACVAEVAAEERDTVDPGSVAVIAPSTLVDEVAAGLEAAGVEFGRAARNGLEQRVTLVPVSLVKGLELDAAVVVEPAAIVDEEAQGMRALYVALTRATKRLSLVHTRELPAPLR